MQRVVEFQRNVSFAAFMLVVCFAAFVYLTQNLRRVLVPLVWSSFFAVPLTCLISHIDEALQKGSSWLLRCIVGKRFERQKMVAFEAVAGRSCIWVDRSSALDTLLQRVNNPCRFNCACLQQAMNCCRRRVRIVEVGACAEVGPCPGDGATGAASAQPALGPKVNALVEGWSYYISEAEPAALQASTMNTPLADEEESVSSPTTSVGGLVQLRLFIDSEGQYPAILDGRVAEGQPIKGVLKVQKSSAISWSFAVLVALALMLLGIWIFITFFALGAMAFQNNVEAYQQGVEGFIDWAGLWLQRVLPHDMWVNMQEQGQHFVSSALPNLATAVLSMVESTGWQAMLFFIYLIFWIVEPLPISSSVATVFKSYLFLKTTVCIVYAALMSLLLLALQCPFWHLFFVTTFLLNYIPEVGPIVSALLMVPAVIFNGHLTLEQRQWNTLWLVIFGSLFKIITANIIEVRMYATRGGQFMRMHPVILMALMMLCDALLGLTGMFMAIPIMAAMKYFMVAADMPSHFLNPLLVLIEGDETAPHKNFVDRCRSEVVQPTPAAPASLSSEATQAEGPASEVLV